MDSILFWLLVKVGCKMIIFKNYVLFAFDNFTFKYVV